jgi:molecular chaperone GrpE
VQPEPPAGEDPRGAPAIDADARFEATPMAGTGALLELDEGALRRLEREAAEWKDRCLRAAAEFENYKKRAVRERTEAGSRAQADLIVRALDALDDLGRIAVLDPAQTTSQTLHEGVGLVERKLQKALEGVGLERLDPAGQPFDPNFHEAVMMMPAASAAADHTVGSVFQPGYRLNGTLLRPARVAVLTWTEPTAEGAAQ